MRSGNGGKTLRTVIPFVGDVETKLVVGEMFLGVVGDVDGEVTLACRKTCRKRDGVYDESIGGGVAVGGIHRLCVCLTL